jgi:antitoxin ParD1/3/4
MTISLPESLKQFVEQQVSAGKYASAEEYIGALVEAERARARLEELIVEGFESGPATEMTAQDWEDIRRKVRERHAARPPG